MVTGDVETDYYLNLSDNCEISRRAPVTYPLLPYFLPIHQSGFHVWGAQWSQSLFKWLVCIDYNLLTFGTVQTYYAGSVRSIILNYGRTDVSDELDGSDCDWLSNALTLTPLVHDEFDRLYLWFEAIPVSGTLMIDLPGSDFNHAEHPAHLQSLHSITALRGCSVTPRTVTFTSLDDKSDRKSVV